MNSILHEITNLHSALIGLICEYNIFELDEKLRKVYLSHVSNTTKIPITKLSPSNQLRYLNTAELPFEIYEQLYIAYLNPYHMDFLLENTNLVLNAEYVFELIFKRKLMPLFKVKFRGRTITQCLPTFAPYCARMMKEYELNDNIDTCKLLITHKVEEDTIIDNDLFNYMLDNCDEVYDIPIRNKALTMETLKHEQKTKLLYSGNYDLKIPGLCHYIPLLNFGILIKHKWFREELYRYHKNNIATPITSLKNFNNCYCYEMDKYFTKKELDFYYKIVDKKSKIRVPYYFNTYYRGNNPDFIQMYGNEKYYDRLCKINIDCSIFENPYINKLIRYL